MNSMYRFINNTQSGFALLLALIIASVVLAIGLTLLNITLKQLTLSTTGRESEIAFQVAGAGIDCLRYWRKEEAITYNDITAGSVTIDCFGQSIAPDSVSRPAVSDGHINLFEYEFEWGSPARCTQLELAVMVADSGASNDFTYTFADNAEVGEKTCPWGELCTIAIARGHNRPCADLTTSILTVQREIVIDY